MPSFTLPGPPIGKGRPRIVRVGGHSRMATPATTRAYESKVALQAYAARAGAPLLDQPLAVRLLITCPIPLSWSAKKRAQALAGQLHPATRPDVDNIIKSILDGLNGALWRDDALVVEIQARKKYGLEPGVAVDVWPI